MNLETLQDQWKTDSKLDDDLHDNDSLAIPQLHMKYMEYHNTYSLMKKERELEMKRLIKSKWLYYKGKAPSSVYKEMPFDLKLTTKEEIVMFIALIISRTLLNGRGFKVGSNELRIIL